VSEVSKLISEDVVKFLDVCVKDLKVFGISDIPITTIKLKTIVQCFLLFSLTISLNSSIKTKIAASLTPSIAFSHIVRK